MDNQELFDHMKDQHGLTLLDSEMLEIELICIKEIKSQLKERDAIIGKLSLTSYTIPIAEWAYKMANPKSKCDPPSIVYEQVEKFLISLTSKNK